MVDFPQPFSQAAAPEGVFRHHGARACRDSNLDQRFDQCLREGFELRYL